MKQKQDGSVWENSQKNEQGEKRKRVARRDRFRRIKNRKEPLYRMPTFLKHTIGCVEISESGIILGEDGFSKVYALKTDMRILCPKLRKQEITYDVFYEAEKRYLLIHYAGRNLEEAYLWFETLEQDLGLTAWDARMRLEYYCKFLEQFLTEKTGTEDCMLQPNLWKKAALYSDIETKNGEIETEEGVFRIAGVRCFKEGAPASGILEKLRKLAVTVCVSVVPVSDQAVADFVRSEYMGLDSIMPRLKRKNPVLYGILAQEKDAVSNEQNYVWGGIYFLLNAADKDEMQEKTRQMVEMGKQVGAIIDILPLARLSTPVEWKKTFAMFGLMGNAQRRFHNLLPSDSVAEITEHSFEKKENASYDIEEMRKLFFEKGATE